MGRATLARALEASAPRAVTVLHGDDHDFSRPGLGAWLLVVDGEAEPEVSARPMWELIIRQTM
ncbi:hypothetical protein [Streptomyces sp. Y1]|uniref:Uncharacterized protein n=1 Tax=Streptomyces sp. Y1 TaxID=3238634 RepID=A0AB39TJS7_9ACTN